MEEVWRFLKKLGINHHMTQQSHYWSHTLRKPKPEKTKILQKQKNKKTKQRYSNIHCSTIYNSENMEATEMSINRLMDKEAVVRIHNGVLFSHKNECI